MPWYLVYAYTSDEPGHGDNYYGLNVSDPYLGQLTGLSQEELLNGLREAANHENGYVEDMDKKTHQCSILEIRTVLQAKYGDFSTGTKL